MFRHSPTLLIVPLLVTMVGCGQVENAAQDGARDAASQAATAAADVVRAQICLPLQDGQLSAQDRQGLSGLLSTAKTAGVPAEFVTPLEEIAKPGDQLPVESVSALRKACGLSPAPTPST